jgi:putative glutamine amidotransferase
MWLFNWLAVRRAGGRAVRLTSQRAAPREPLDGLVIGGGDDVDASLYGGDVRLAVRIDSDRDALEYRVLREARARDLPVLGICRGAQILNVFLGGTLHGDIYAAFNDLPRQRALLPLKRIDILPGTRLHDIIGLSRCRVNSIHHQSVNHLAAGLKVAAVDRHGIVQGLDAEVGTFIVGVQWHPEFLVFNRPQQRLFRALVDAARDHRAARLPRPAGQPSRAA